MQLIYWLGIRMYGLAARLYALFDSKARLWVEGRKNIIQNIRQKITGLTGNKIWIHCASLGEFEQAVPVIEQLKKHYSGHKIILTFFSPSGFEQKKNTALADAVFYLPEDSPSNARSFVETVQPEFAIFVKYEFWHFYISELRKRNIPLYVISARFTANQIFFQWYGGFFRKMLHHCTRLFVQDRDSLLLLDKTGIRHATVSGDTRYDRVKFVASRKNPFPDIELFCNGRKVIIAGSTWPEDEALLAACMNNIRHQAAWIIAPHEISDKHLKQLENTIPKTTLRYSAFRGETADVLIIDNIGMLSSLYRFGHLAYVGGGFGRGLHNILEPAAYGLPVIFGNRFQSYSEAVSMMNNGTGFFVSHATQLAELINNFFSDDQRLKSLSEKQKLFIDRNAGATEKIISFLVKNS